MDKLFLVTRNEEYESIEGIVARSDSRLSARRYNVGEYGQEYHHGEKSLILTLDQDPNREYILQNAPFRIDKGERVILYCHFEFYKPIKPKRMPVEGIQVINDDKEVLFQSVTSSHSQFRPE